MSWPSAVTVPLLAVTMPQMMLISVVLPAPLGPSSAKISPAFDVEIDELQGLKARGVGFGDVVDRDDGPHASNTFGL